MIRPNRAYQKGGNSQAPVTGKINTESEEDVSDEDVTGWRRTELKAASGILALYQNTRPWKSLSMLRSAAAAISPGRTQNGRTITRITIPTMSSVGTSLTAL